MSLEQWIQETWPQPPAPAEAASKQDAGSSPIRVEPCEFERLLERAMEILSVRSR